MAVRVRLTRVGSKKNPIWRVVVADQRSPRDGRDHRDDRALQPQTEPSTIVLDEERLAALAGARRAADQHREEADARQGRRAHDAATRASVPWRTSLEYLARALVDEPDEVSVESFEEDDGTLVLELTWPRTTPAR